MAIKIALVGKATSGKDTIKNLLVNDLKVKPETSYTTRPPRKGEINGLSYHFVNESEFHSIDMLEKVNFNGWWYGKSKSGFESSQVFIFTPIGISLLPEYARNQLTVFFLDVSEEDQIKRMQERGDTNDNDQRRILADKKDFENFKNYNYRINTSLLNVEDTYHKILEHFNFR